MTEPIIELKNLTRTFGPKTALDDVSLTVEKGAILGLVGENGSGKTTLIKHVLGLYRPDSGSVRVMGLNPVDDPVGVLSNIGYLSEEDTLAGWMRVRELLRYMQGLYPNWNQTYAHELLQQFGIDPNAQLLKLSKGQRARAGLVAALAHRPELLLLDEPSSGLDPIVRRDILGAIVRAIAEDGRTAVFSSHLLGEVGRIADRVAMIKEGKVVFCENLDDLTAGHLALTLVFSESRPVPPRFAGIISAEGGGREWSVVFKGDEVEVITSAQSVNATVADHRGANLDEIFVAYSRPTGDGK